MKGKRKRQVNAFFAVILALAMVLPGMAPAAQAAGISAGKTELTVNSSVVAFGGYEWYVIGDASSGVYSQNDSVTLLAKTLQSEWNSVPFRMGSSSEFTDSQQYSYDSRYYASNPDGMENWTTPNEYAGSTLQQKMESIASGFSPAEQSLINARNFTGGGTYDNPSTDGIAGPGLTSQKVWALSSDEWAAIGNSAVLSYGDWWWLRSPYSFNGIEARQGYRSGGHMDDYNVHFESDAVRPALSLNLSSVLFTSLAADGGKSSATVGSNLVGAEAPPGTVKFTMRDDTNQKLTVVATTEQSKQSAEKLAFSYTGATTGTNQYVSCVLTDSNENVKYYGKLADSSNAASGTLSIPLSNVSDGTYTLKIFSEQANGDLYTDFASNPVTMSLSVSNGTGTVSNFSGTIHDHNWSTDWSYDDTAHWHNCTADGCPATDNALKDGYAVHTYDQKVVSNIYKATVADCTNAAAYYYSCLCGAKGTSTFTNGDALGHDWGEVSYEWAEDGKTCTAKRACKTNADHTETANATVTSGQTKAPTCTEMGETTYTAAFSEEWAQSTPAQTKTLADIPANGHVYEHHGEVAATHAADGKAEHYTCTDCDLLFDADKQETTAEALVIAKLGHTFSGAWESDETNHWHECSCGEKSSVLAHTFVWKTDKEAKVGVAGSRHEECKVCGYRKAAEEIPALEAPAYPPEIEKTDGGSVTVTPADPKAGDTVTITVKPEDGKQVDQLIVTDENGNTILIKDNGDGTYSFTQPESKVAIKTTFKAKETGTTANPHTETTDKTAPQTGDERNLALWLILLGVSVAGLTGTVIYGRKRRVSKSK